jgi:hypothetical protein
MGLLNKELLESCYAWMLTARALGVARADVGPIRVRDQVLAYDSAIRLALKCDTQTSSELLPGTHGFAQVALTCFAGRGECRALCFRK